MTQAELNRAVARATGETIQTIVDRGFIPLEPVSDGHEPLVVDWDELDQRRRVPLFPRRERVPA